MTVSAVAFSECSDHHMVVSGRLRLMFNLLQDIFGVQHPLIQKVRMHIETTQLSAHVYHDMSDNVVVLAETYMEEDLKLPRRVLQ